jgi:hypothetical protein
VRGEGQGRRCGCPRCGVALGTGVELNPLPNPSPSVTNDQQHAVAPVRSHPLPSPAFSLPCVQPGKPQWTSLEERASCPLSARWRRASPRSVGVYLPCITRTHLARQSLPARLCVFAQASSAMSDPLASTVLCVRPAAFGSNPDTLASNAFQAPSPEEAAERAEVAADALQASTHGVRPGVRETGCVVHGGRAWYGPAVRCGAGPSRLQQAAPHHGAPMPLVPPSFSGVR